MIELLVVIAIIAILAGLLFPVFARAKSAAKDSTTLSNLHQMGVAFDLYEGDFDDLFPGVTDGSLGTNVVGGWVYYDVFGNGGPGHFDVTRGSLFPYAKNKMVYTSPNDSDSGASGLSFAYNGCLITTPYMTTGINFGMSATGIANPAETMELGEEGTSQSIFGGADGDTNDGFFNPEVDRFANWHAGGTAILFADSHGKITHAADHFIETTSGNPTQICW